VTDDGHKLEALPSVIPVFPLPGAILIPGSSLPLNIFEPRYLKMVRDAIAGNGLVGMIQPKPEDKGTRPDLYSIGGVGSIADVKEAGGDRFMIRLKGLSRFEIEEELSVTTPYRQVRANWAPFADDPWGGTQKGPVERGNLLDALKRYLTVKGLDADFDAIASAPDDVLVNTLAMIVPFPSREKQALLEAESVANRCELLKSLLEMASTNTVSGEPGASH
jgi:Lon protease-like protein